jgi:hypothetical protein
MWPVGGQRMISHNQGRTLANLSRQKRMRPFACPVQAPLFAGRHAATYGFDLVPLTGSLGGEIRGVDLGRDLSEVDLSEIRRAFLDHSVLVFRGQVA